MVLLNTWLISRFNRSNLIESIWFEHVERILFVLALAKKKTSLGKNSRQLRVSWWFFLIPFWVCVWKDTTNTRCIVQSVSHKFMVVRKRNHLKLLKCQNFVSFCLVRVEHKLYETFVIIWSYRHKYVHIWFNSYVPARNRTSS